MSTTPAAAELVWDKTEIEQTVISGDTTTVTEFRFRNAGRLGVRILAVRPSCNCTTYDLDQMNYEAGEAGVIKLRMDLRNGQGTLDRTVDVVYEDTTLSFETLHWRVTIPDAVIIKPDTLVWRAGEIDTRIIGIARAGRAPISVKKVECSSDSFVWQLVTVSENEAYELLVAPRNPARNAAATFRILVGPPGKETQHEVSASIHP